MLELSQRNTKCPTKEFSMSYQLHLAKPNMGMSTKTACGRKQVNTVLSACWSEFKVEPAESRCIKCATSKQAEFFAKNDLKKQAVSDLLSKEQHHG